MNPLEHLDILAIVPDDSNAPIRADFPAPATQYCVDNAFVDLGVDESGERITTRNEALRVDFGKMLRVDLRSKTPQKLHVMLQVHGTFLRPEDGDLGRLAAGPSPMTPIGASCMPMGSVGKPGCLGSMAEIDGHATVSVLFECDRGMSGILVVSAIDISDIPQTEEDQDDDDT